MSKKAFNNMMELSALETEREGMKAENDLSMATDQTLAFDMEDFALLAERIRNLKLVETKKKKKTEKKKG